MDASRLVNMPGHDGLKINSQTSVRIAIADALRDMADEIESGDRIVSDIQTQEAATASERIRSSVYIVSNMKRK
jgi:hypothetical protein